MRRLLKDKRPLGPLFGGSDGSEQQQCVESIKEDESDVGTVEVDIGDDELDAEVDVSHLLEQAENWHSSLMEETSKRDMMEGWLSGNTNLSENDIDKILDEAGL